MKKLLLILTLLITTVAFGQRCLLVGNDTVSFDEKNFMISKDTTDAHGILTTTYSYLNEACEWDLLYTKYYSTEEVDTLQVNDSLVYIVYTTGQTIYDSLIRETWEKDSIWTHTFTDYNGAGIEASWGDNDTSSFDVYRDNVNGLLSFWRTIPDGGYYPTIFNDYVYNSEGDIIEETISRNTSMTAHYKYDQDGPFTKKLNHYPSQDQFRWLIESSDHEVTIRYQEFDYFFWEWTTLTSKVYPDCWGWIVDVPERIALVDSGNELYMDLLGREYTEPPYGFYIYKGKKYYRQ